MNSDGSSSVVFVNLLLVSFPDGLQPTLLPLSAQLSEVATIAEELNGYIPQVLKPDIILVGVTALSHAFEKRLLKLNLLIPLPGLLCINYDKQSSNAFLEAKIHHNLMVELHGWYVGEGTELKHPFV